MAIRNFLVTLKLFLNAKCSLFVWSKWQIGHRKWFLNTNLFLIKPFLTATFDCTLTLGGLCKIFFLLKNQSLAKEESASCIFLHNCNFLKYLKSTFWKSLKKNDFWIFFINDLETPKPWNPKTDLPTYSITILGIS